MMNYFIGILTHDDWSTLKLVRIDTLDIESHKEMIGPIYGQMSKMIQTISFKTTSEFLIDYMSQWMNPVKQTSIVDKRTLWFIQAQDMNISTISCQGCFISEVDEPTKIFFKFYKYTISYDYSDFNPEAPTEIKQFILSTIRDEKLNKLLNS